MRAERSTITQYVFTEEEVEQLENLGVWDLILSRLTENERVEIVKEWVGLTDEEAREISRGLAGYAWAARESERILQEKNT